MSDLNVCVVMLVNREKIERLRLAVGYYARDQETLKHSDLTNNLLDDLTDAEHRLAVSIEKLTPEGWLKHNRASSYSDKEALKKTSIVDIGELEL